MDTIEARRRSRGGNETLPVRYYWEGDPGNVQSYFSVTAMRTLEFLQDSRNPFKEGHWSVGNCVHKKYAVHCENYFPWFGDNSLLVTPIQLPPFFSSEDLESVIPAYPYNLINDLNEEAFNSFTALFPEKISFSEFILGFTKLKELLPKLEDSVIKTLAGGYLTQKFGWDNLLSDLETLSHLCKDIQARLKFLRDTYGKPTRLGFYRGDMYPVTLGSYLLEKEPQRGWGLRLKLEKHRMDYRAGGWLYQELSHLNDSIGFFRAFMYALGLGNPLKAVWVNLPMSFVVDWFFKISQHLDRVATLRPTEPWYVSRMTNTTIQSGVIGVYQFNDHQVNSTPNPERKLGTVNYEVYRRGVGLPIDLSASLQPSNLNPSQLTLLLAMLAGSSR